jgi:hypothetical protein
MCAGERKFLFVNINNKVVIIKIINEDFMVNSIKIYVKSVRY